MSKQDRREAARAWKERKAEIGVFVVRCAATGQAWVGATPNPDAAQNKLWFSLKTGGYPNKGLQQAWTAHGEGAFSLDLLERREWDAAGSADPAYVRNALMKDRATYWRAELGAEAA